MASRPRVIDLRDPHAGKALACPACGASLEHVKKHELIATRVPCRCRLGHVLYETRCQACATIVLLRDGTVGLVLAGRGHASASQDREDAVRAIERRFERDR